MRAMALIRPGTRFASAMTRYTRVVPHTGTRIIGALLVVLLGTAQGVAAVCESFCPRSCGRCGGGGFTCWCASRRPGRTLGRTDPRARSGSGARCRSTIGPSDRRRISAVLPDLECTQADADDRARLVCARGNRGRGGWNARARSTARRRASTRRSRASTSSRAPSSRHPDPSRSDPVVLRRVRSGRATFINLIRAGRSG